MDIEIEAEKIMALMLAVIQQSELPSEKKDELMHKQILIFKDLCEGSPEDGEQAVKEVMEAFNGGSY